MAHPHIEPLNVSSLAWALDRALRYAIATAVVALILSALLSGESAERLASTAFLAAVFAALVLAIKRFLTVCAQEPPKVGLPALPAVLSFSLLVAVFVTVGAALVSEPEAEAIAILACLGLIVLAAVLRSGAIPALNAGLAQGGVLAATTRYGVAAAIAALGVSSFLAPRAAEGFVRFAYSAMIVATLSVSASLIAPTRAGMWLRQSRAYLTTLLRSPASAWVFARTSKYAVGTAVLALVMAALLPKPYAERFAVAAYLAVLFAALGIGVTLLLRRVTVDQFSEPTPRAPLAGRLRFGGGVAGLALAGAAVVSNPIAEMLAILVCVCSIGAAIVKRYRR